MDDFALMASGTTEETGSLFGDMVDAVNGGPQKRRRTREAQREAEAAMAEAAKLSKAAQALRTIQGPSAAPASSVPASSVLDRLKAPSPIGGLPWWVVGLVVVGGVALAVRR